MNMFYKNFISALLFVGLSVPAFSQHDNKVQIQTAHASPGVLKIDVVDSPIFITGYDGDTIEFEPIPEDTDKQKNFQNLIFDVAKSGNDIIVSTHRKRSKGINVVVKIPRQYSVEARTVYGEQVKIENVSGSISVYAHAGNILLTRVSGSLDLYSANGKIVVAATSFSNDVPSIITNVYGDVRLVLPASIKATLEINSFSKKVNSEFELKQAIREVRPENDLQQHAEKLKSQENGPADKQKAIESIVDYVSDSIGKTINGGGPVVNLKLHSGSLNIVKSVN